MIEPNRIVCAVCVASSQNNPNNSFWELITQLPERYVALRDENMERNLKRVNMDESRKQCKPTREEVSKWYACNEGSIDQCCRRTRWPLYPQTVPESHNSYNDEMAHTRFKSTFHHFFTVRCAPNTNEPMVMSLISVYVEKREWFCHLIKSIPVRCHIHSRSETKENFDLLNEECDKNFNVCHPFPSH